MLFLLFRIGEDRYVLDVSRVTEVLPLVTIKALPGAPHGVSGAFNYRGTPTPVIDLNLLAIGKPAHHRLSTRLIIVRYCGESGRTQPLALIAEHATDMLRRDPSDFLPSGISGGATSYLGPVAPDRNGLVQWVEPERLLPPAVHDALFRQLTGAH